MLTSKIKELAQARDKVQKLEQAIATETQARLRNLHSELGYESVGSLIKALRAAAKGGPKRRGRKPGTGARKGKGRRRRAKITPELRQSIIDAVKAGGTGNAVARKFGVSLPTVQNIKRDAGLTRTAKAAKGR